MVTETTSSSSSTTSVVMTESATMNDANGLLYDLGIAFFTLGQQRKQRTEILQLVQLSPGMQVLDVACGTGEMALIASSLCGPSGRVVGIDASPTFVQRAMSKTKGMNPNQIAFVEGIAETLPFNDGTFDLVMMTLSLHHFTTDESQKAVLAEMSRVLKPGGNILLVDFPGGRFGTKIPKSMEEQNGHSVSNGKGNSKCKHHHHHHSHEQQHGHHHHQHHSLPIVPCFSSCTDDNDEKKNFDVESDPLYKKVADAGFFFVEGWKVNFFGTIAVTGRK